MITVALLLSYLITPLGVMLLIISIFGAPSHKKKYALFIGLTFGMIGYCSSPVREIDIVRYFQQIEGIRGLPFSRAFSWAEDGLIVKNLIFWIIARIGDNHILPFLSLMTVYTVSSYILIHTIRENKKTLGYLLALQLMLIPFYNCFSNVRNVMAFSLLAMAFYRDLIEKKMDLLTGVLYVVPCFIHMAGLVLVLLRILLPLFSKLSFLSLGVTFGIPAVVILLYPMIQGVSFGGNLGRIVNRAIWKAYGSFVRTSDYAQEMQTHGAFVVNRLLAIVFCVVLLYIIVSCLGKEVKMEKGRRYYLVAVEMITSLSLIMAVMGVVKFWVFMFMVYVMFTPVIVWVQEGQILKAREYQICMLLIGSVALFSLLMQIRSIVANLDISYFLSNFLLTNYLDVIVNILKGLFL